MAHNWIKRARKIMTERKITQRDLLPVMGKTTRGAVSHYFTGRSTPTIAQMESLAKYLGVSLQWLVSDNGGTIEVDDEILEVCLSLITETIDGDDRLELSASQQARLAVYLYSLIKEGEELNTRKVGELMRLFA